MRVIEHINQSQNTRFSFELLPPLRGTSIEKIYESIDMLMDFSPPYINVTYHQEEIEYKLRADGLMEPKTVWKRPGTVGISAALQYKYGVDIVPHIICGGFNAGEIENILIDLDFLGIENLLVVRGDINKRSGLFEPKQGGWKYAIDLVKQVNNLNQGIYLDQDLENAVATKFCMGVAGYPEKHCEAPNPDSDLRRLKEKVEAGAEYIVSQMFFDNQKYFEFVDHCRNNDIHVPIIPGIKPVAVKRHLNILPKVFHIDLPADLSNAIEKCKDNKDVRQVGVEWAIQQSRELMDYGVPLIHYYTMGKADNIAAIAKAVF